MFITKKMILRPIAWMSVFCGVVLTIGACSSSKKTAVDPSEMSFDIKVHPYLVEVDNLGRIYVVDDKNKIINYAPDLVENYRYANKRSGNLTSLDVTNPLKITAFFDDFNKVKVLDNTLTIISELDLSDKFADVTACASSNDGNLWIFDPVQFKLLKVDDGGNVLLETSNVNDIGMVDVHVSDIRERGNYVVLCDRDKGFYFFDNLGQYIYSYEAKGVLSFQFDGRNVYYFTATGLKNYSVKFKEKQMMGYPTEMNKPSLKYVLFQSGDLYEVNANGINVLKVKGK